MEIRQLKEEEFDVSVSLSEYAFQYKLSDEDRLKAKQRFKPDRIWGIFDQEALGAKLTILPLQIYIQGQPVSMGGIAGVATWPENRRQGLVSKLLTHTLQTMNEAGHAISLLHPFLIPFYRRFGWEVFCEYKKYTIPVSNFPKKVEIEGVVKRDVDTVETLDRLYQQFAANYNGTLKRDRDWWEHSILNEDWHQAVFYSISGEPKGYVIYKIENKVLRIDEFIYLNEQARQGLWTFLANHDSMVTSASLKLVPADDMLPYLLPDPRIAQENYPYFMARIVNAQALLERYKLRAQGVISRKTFYIEDHEAPWNNGLWEWNVSAEGESQLNQIKGEDNTAELTCSIGTLTVLLLGYKRPSELARFGLLNGTEAAIEWLEEAVLPAQTALFDFF
ncbi:GNAT family N-acetyltransferase [Paenibacillus donghaensis]|uniref:GNAT family N-acetyltransferase n=1 Tax=Paenibacillus donghaensis TaxID=414771 RepID=A0A2Z2KTH7_9BACL|nr:GNAT family N-acetyltransferase [Paenibacillus donghaensis]